LDLSDFSLCVSTERARRVRVGVRGDLDHVTKAQLVETVAALCGRCDALVIDLSEVDFVDAGGLGALAAVKGICDGATIDFRVDGDPPMLARLLEITGIELPRTQNA
jgi:anti-sigma B factor antagonist